MSNLCVSWTKPQLSGTSPCNVQVSELGDKTFFIAAILAMRNNKLTVFLAAVSALAVMTVLSALLGLVRPSSNQLFLALN